MVNKIVIVVFIIFIAVVSVTAYLYFYSEKPAQEKVIEYNNVSLAFFDKDNNFVRSSYVISINSDDNIYQQGTTEASGYSLIKIPVNTSFFITNENNGSMNYYSSQFKADAYGVPKNIRAEIKLETPGSCSVSSKDKLSSSNLILNIDCEKPILYPLICFRWTQHIITTKVLNSNYTISQTIPKRLSDKIDKCYDVSGQLTSQNLSIQVATTGILLNEDYLKVVIVNGNKKYNGLITYESNDESSPIFPDYEFTINN